jgi:clathrin heavy chain
MINAMRQQTNKIAALEKDNEERKVKEATQQKAEDTTPILGNRLMLTAGPGGMAPQPYANGIAPQVTGFGGF